MYHPEGFCNEFITHDARRQQGITLVALSDLFVRIRADYADFKSGMEK
jgi:hypothetical protein